MSVHAKVRLTIEVDVPSHWNDDVQLSQVHKQATVDAIGSIERACIEGGSRWRVIGEPIIEAVIVRGKP